MIVFDLACREGHVFEAWFGSSADYDSQRARGLVACPLCGRAEIDKAVMAPRLAAKGNSRRASDAPAPPQRTEEAAVAVKAMIATLAEAQARMLATSSYVGNRFADEARAIHHGETEQRSIYGRTTGAEARALLDDGIEVAPLPFPVRPPGTDN